VEHRLNVARDGGVDEAIDDAERGSPRGAVGEVGVVILSL